MKIAIVGDLHFGARNASEDIFYHQDRFFNFLFSEMQSRGVSTLIQLGDVFDNRRQTNSKALNFAYTHFFDKLEDMGVQTHVLVGNHSLFYRENFDITSDNLLLQKYDNVKVYDKPECVEFDGVKFDIVPWICDENREELLEYIEHSSSEYICGHFDISGFEMVPGSESVTGLLPSVFSRYHKVFSGHFHIRSEKGNIIYVGTPYELTWNDAKSDKQFLVFDTETRTFERVLNPFHAFYTVEYDDVNKVFTDFDTIDLAHAFVKVMIRNKTEPYLYNLFTSRLIKLKPADVKFIDCNIVALNESVNIEQTVLTQSMEDIIRDYIIQQNFNNKSELTNYMIALYNEALSGGSTL